jgi:hypothetical protein
MGVPRAAFWSHCSRRFLSGSRLPISMPDTPHYDWYRTVYQRQPCLLRLIGQIIARSGRLTLIGGPLRRSGPCIVVAWAAHYGNGANNGTFSSRRVFERSTTSHAHHQRSGTATRYFYSNVMSSVPLHGEWSSCRGIVDTTMRILVQFDVHGNESLKNFAGLGSQTLEARVRDV